MRVLIIEDEPELRRVLAQAFREDGYAVDEAADGPDGLYKGMAWDYDLVLLDLMLPGLDGLSLLAQLRKERKTPVLILTARDAIADRVRGLNVGADDYVVKPFDLGEVLARARALIRRSAGRAKSHVEVGGVVIDTVQKSVLKNGTPVTLTAREYSILELLVHHRGRVVTKSLIYDHIFDENDDSLSNLVEVHVSNIRRKLGREFIETRRGMGYVVNG
jgi:two-component system OmpR family response regulator